MKCASLIPALSVLCLPAVVAAPGTLTSLKTITFERGSTLQIEIGGPAAGTEHDRIVAAGVQFAYDGAQSPAGPSVQVSLINGYTPAAAAMFDVIEAPVTGQFGTLSLPGAGWTAPDLLVDGTVRYAPGGYDSWAAGFGLAGASALADADLDGDGVVNLAEYTLGTSPVLGADTAAVLPSPALAAEGAGQTPRITFSLPDPGREDVRIEIQAQNALDGTWSSIASRDGLAAWSGTATVTESAPAGGRISVTAAESSPVSAVLRRFYRLKFTRL